MEFRKGWKWLPIRNCLEEVGHTDTVGRGYLKKWNQWRVSRLRKLLPTCVISQDLYKRKHRQKKRDNSIIQKWAFSTTTFGCFYETICTINFFLGLKRPLTFWVKLLFEQSNAQTNCLTQKYIRFQYIHINN